MTEQPAPAPAPSGPNRNMIMMVVAAVAIVAVAATFLMQPPTPSQQAAKGTPPPAEIPIKDLMAPSGLPDVGYGKADAPVTIVEYASLSCVHCANFHKNVLPKLKEKYIDTGKVRLVYREFPFDQIGFILAALTRCGGEEKTMALANDFFVKSDTWMPPAGNPETGIRKIWEANGMKPEEIDSCLKNKSIQTKLVQARERADKFGVRSTPTFFINGKRMTLRPDLIESFDKMIEPLIKG